MNLFALFKKKFHKKENIIKKKSTQSINIKSNNNFKHY